MITVYSLKPRFQNLLHPLLSFFVERGMTPNMLTMMAFIGSTLTGGMLLLARSNPAWLILIPIWLFARMALNALDGMMAREFKMMTDMGAVLNEVGDVVSDLALYLPLCAVEPSASLPIVLFCFGAALTEFCGVLSQALGRGRRYDGPLGKSDRAFLVGALALNTVVFPQVFTVWKWVFLGAALLSVWTCERRLHHTLHECSRQHS